MEEKTQLLEKLLSDSGKTKTFLAEKIGVSRPRLYYIFEHPDTATLSQAEGICKELSIKKSERDFIFLG